MKAASKEYKQTMNKYIRKYKKDTENMLRSLRSQKPKDHWKILNRFRKPSETKTDFNTLYDYFKDINSNGEEDYPFIIDPDHQGNINELLNDEISIDEIINAIKDLKSGKLAGIDDILREHIKSTAHILFSLTCFPSILHFDFRFWTLT